MRYIWENSVRNCAVCIANMPRFILKLWNREGLEKGGRWGGGRKRKNLWYQYKSCSLQGCIAKHRSTISPPIYCMEAQLKLRYSQEGLKNKKQKTKKAQRGPDWLNRCFGSSKALVPWLCHTLEVKHEAGGGEGVLKRGLPIQIFSVFRLPLLFVGSLS